MKIVFLVNKGFIPFRGASNYSPPCVWPNAGRWRPYRSGPSTPGGARPASRGRWHPVPRKNWRGRGTGRVPDSAIDFLRGRRRPGPPMAAAARHHPSRRCPSPSGSSAMRTAPGPDPASSSWRTQRARRRCRTTPAPGELRHSTDGIVCRLIKMDHTTVSKNGQIVSVVQYFELSMKDAMFIINERLKRKVRAEQVKGNSLDE
jgi:hypothetical protein